MDLILVYKVTSRCPVHPAERIEMVWCALVADLFVQIMELSPFSVK